MDTSSSEKMIKKTFDYYLTHEKVIRQIVPSQKDNYACLGCYALNVVEELQSSKTEIIRDEFESKWSKL